jgi:hypothetical protein
MKKPRVVLVCGGRHYADAGKVNATLSALRPRPTKIITGDARGADALAYLWAWDHGVEYEGFPADWRNFGKAAGPLRNSQMLNAEKVDLVVAFPGGAGTADMVAKARAKNIPVQEMLEENL